MTDALKNLDLAFTLYEIKLIPRKGKGLVARVDIAKGTRILVEKPFLTQVNVPNLQRADELEKELASKLKSLPKLEQRRYLSLHNAFPGKYPFTGIFKTNCFPCGPSGSVIGGVFPTICLINHSCLPNVHHNWNEEIHQETIHAIRPIRAGEEILVSYLPRGGRSSDRKAYLKENLGFDCVCSVCSLPADELELSDNRRFMIEHFDQVNNMELMQKDPDAYMANCNILLQAILVEFGDSPGMFVARLFYDCFRVCVSHGDFARASVFGERAYNSMVVCGGEDDPDQQSMKRWVVYPETHPKANSCSMRWISENEDVPEDLDAEELERWLWRGNVEGEA